MPFMQFSEKNKKCVIINLSFNFAHIVFVEQVPEDWKLYGISLVETHRIYKHYLLTVASLY